MISAHEILRLPRLSLCSFEIWNDTVELYLADGVLVKTHLGVLGEIEDGSVECDYDTEEYTYRRSAEITVERVFALFQVHAQSVAPELRREAACMDRKARWLLDSNQCQLEAWCWADGAHALRAMAHMLAPVRKVFRPSSTFLRTLPEVYDARAEHLAMRLSEKSASFQLPGTKNDRREAMYITALEQRSCLQYAVGRRKWFAHVAQHAKFIAPMMPMA